jgi:hypothetical protein
LSRTDDECERPCVEVSSVKYGKMTIPARYLDRFQEDLETGDDAVMWGATMPSSGEEDSYAGGREFI